MAQEETMSAITIGKKACTLALGGLVVASGLVGGAGAANAAPISHTGAFAGVSATESPDSDALPEVPEGQVLLTKIDGTRALTSEGQEVSLEGATAVTLGDILAEENPENLAEIAPELLIDRNPEWVDDNMPELRDQVMQDSLEGAGGGGGAGAPAAMSAFKTVDMGEWIKWGNNSSVYFIMADGSIAWCVEPGITAPLGSGVSEYQTGFNGYYSERGMDFVHLGPKAFNVSATTPDQVKRMSVLMDTPADPGVKAYALWLLRSGDAGYAEAMQDIADNAGPEFTAAANALVADVTAKAANLFNSQAEADAYVKSQAAAVASPGKVEIGQPDPKNIYHQKATVKANANAWTDTVELVGGVFMGNAPAGVTYNADKTIATIAQRTTDIVLDVELTPTKNDKKMYQWNVFSSFKGSQTFTAEWRAPAVSSWYFGPGEQKTVYAPGPKGKADAKAAGENDNSDPANKSTEFPPTLKSKIVTVKGEVGKPLTLDTLEFATASDIEWRRDYKKTVNGKTEYTFREITARANVYYHGKGKPKPSSEPYGDTYRLVATVAPIQVAGPGPYEGEIPAPLDEDGNHYVPDEAGFYVYQWIIDYKDQNQAARDVLPENYVYADEYGDPNETPIIPPQLGLETELSDDEITLDEGYDENGKFVGYQISDLVQLGSNDVGWLSVDNKRIPITVDVDFYGYKGELTQSRDVPEDAVKLGSATAVVDAPRKKIESGEAGVSLDQFREFDGVTAVACVVSESQLPEYADMVFNECHDYGMPEESAPFVKPEIRTEAKTDGAVPGMIYDTAIVEKSDLPAGSTIGATAYKTPTVGDFKYEGDWTPVLGDSTPVLDENGEPVMEEVPQLDEDGNPVLDEDGNPVVDLVAKVTPGEPQRWTQEEIDAIPADALCEIQPVGKTERVLAREQGRYKLPDVQALSDGEINWVEDTLIPGGEDGEMIEWSRGKCGDVNEITVVEKPKVSTDTQFKDVYPGGENWDNVHVSGIAEGEDFGDWELVSTVEGFYTDSYTAPAVCSIDENSNKIVDLAVPGPITENVTYESERYKMKQEWLGGRIDHVENLVLRNKVTEKSWEIAKGECGYSTESTVVPEPKVTTEVQNKDVKPGDKNHDNIIVKDLPEILPETGGESQYTYEATVKVFVADDHKAPAECKVPALELDAVEVKGNGITESAEYTIKEEWAAKRLDHVETLWAVDKEGNRINVHTGECGAANESSFVEKPAPPVNTGTNNAGLIALIAGGVVLAGGGAATAYAIRRKKAAVK